MQISRSALQFWVQLIVLILTISAWGWSIRSDVGLLSARQEALSQDVDRLSKEVRMQQLDIKSLQLALAAKGIIVKGDIE